MAGETDSEADSGPDDTADRAPGPVQGSTLHLESLDVPVCPRGHQANPGDEFCPTCGDALWTTCPAGHRAVAADGFCGTCGRALAGAKGRRRFLLLGALGAGVLVAVAAAGWVLLGAEPEGGEVATTGTTASTEAPTSTAAPATTEPSEADSGTTGGETEVGRTESLTLGSDGIGIAVFGDPLDQAAGPVGGLLGRPGAEQPCGLSTNGMQMVWWFGTFVGLDLYGDAAGDFVGYRLYSTMGGEPDFSAFVTATGVGIDTTRAEVEAAYGTGVEVDQTTSTFGVDGDALRGGFDLTIFGEDGGAVNRVEAGEICPQGEAP